MKTKKYVTVRLEIFQQRLSTPRPHSRNTEFPPNIHQLMYLFANHHNVQQRVSLPRSQSIADGWLQCQCTSTNGSMSILMASKDSILPIYFNSLRAVVSVTWIIMNTLLIYDGFLTQKSYYNKNQYKNDENQGIFQPFCKKHSCTTNIKRYGPISVSRYVYVIYLSKTEGRDAKLAQS